MIKILITLLITTILSASVEIYQDKVKQTLLPKEKFIGFNANIYAYDKYNDLKIIKQECNESQKKSCISSKKISKLEIKIKSLKNQKDALSLSLTKLSIKINNPEQTIYFVEIVSNKIANISNDIKANQNLLIIEKNKKSSPTQDAYYFEKKPKNIVNIEFRGIDFFSEYDLNIDQNIINHNIVLNNRSGIDIKNSQAKVIDRRLSGLSPNFAFIPRKISQRDINKKNTKKSSISRKISYDIEMITSAALIAKKESTRYYKIDNFTLVSNGLNKKYTVEEQKIEISKVLQWNVWEKKVFEVVTIPYKTVLESNNINLIYNDLKTKKIYPRRDGKNLIINIAQEYDIEVNKKSIPNFSQSKGFINSDTLITNGFKLTLSNLSKNHKKLKIIERIPVSTNEDIEVEFSEVWEIIKNDRKKVAFSYDKKIGKLELFISLDSEVSRVFEYKYSIRHPKKVRIFY